MASFPAPEIARFAKLHLICAQAWKDNAVLTPSKIIAVLSDCMEAKPRTAGNMRCYQQMRPPLWSVVCRGHGNYTEL
eukprot:7555201-Pyramimonas_sp.AAC.1